MAGDAGRPAHTAGARGSDQPAASIDEQRPAHTAGARGSDQPAASIDEQRPAHAAAGAASDEPIEPGVVLVVEDDPIGRRTLELAVGRYGHHVRSVPDGRQALEALQDQVADLVLLDLVMPELDGFGVLAAIRADPSLAEVPVLVISAVEDTASVARAIEMGAVDCLPKPFDPVLLRARLRTALQQGRLRRLEQAYLRQELVLRQNDRLATLGKLSAGLAHELNNPAAAALRTLDHVGRQVAEVQQVLGDLAASPGAGPATATALQLLQRLLDQRGDVPTGALERADAEDDLADALARAGITGPPGLAGDLVGAGFGPAAISMLTALDPAAAALVLRLSAGLAAMGDGLARASASVQRISDIIGALRSYSYLDQAPRQEVDVRVGLTDTLVMLAHAVPDGVAIVRDDADDLPPVRALGPQLNQVWTNLLDNALDAVGERGTITLRTRSAPGPDGPVVVVEVEDDGPGIPPDLVGRIFDPFVTTKPPGQGTGLGLNISHQIVTDGHGGRLEVASEPGRTRFTVTLPAAGATHPLDEDDA